MDQPKIVAAIIEMLIDADPRTVARWNADPESYLELLETLRNTEDAAQELTRSVIVAARSAGNSWEQIGKSLGISRQASHKRFASTENCVDLDESTTKRVPVTIYSEMRILNHAGSLGWHSIAIGPKYHLLKRSSSVWMHMRVASSPKFTAPLEQDDWIRVEGSSFPWVYFKKRRENHQVIRTAS